MKISYGLLAYDGSSKEWPLQHWLSWHRRTFHSLPELSGNEHETMERVCEVLTTLDIPHKRNLGGNGILAWLDTGRPGPQVAFRADMDALPIYETSDTSYTSQIPGVMHACGHDGHMAIALGILRELKDSPWLATGNGKIFVVFQPAEETGLGAKAILPELTRHAPKLQAMFAFHVFPHLFTGEVGLADSVCCAAIDKLEIIVEGSGGHPARPDLCSDTVGAAVHLVTLLQGLVARTLAPSENAVLAITNLHTPNDISAIPEKVIIRGLIRSLNEETRQIIIRECHNLVDGVARSFSLKISQDIKIRFPLLLNAPTLVEHCKEFLGTQNSNCTLKQVLPQMMGEDFAHFGTLCPSVMLWLGCSSNQEYIRQLHTSTFDFDEKCMECGVTSMVLCLTMYMNRSI